MTGVSHKRKLLAWLSLLSALEFLTPRPAAEASLALKSQKTEIRISPDLPSGLDAKVSTLLDAFRIDLAAKDFLHHDRFPPVIRLAKLDPSLGLSVWARSAADVIELNPRVPTNEFASVARHELAHVLLNSVCPELSVASPVVSETFALWLSGDFQRVVHHGKRFLFAKEARTWLEAATTAPTRAKSQRERKNMEAALSRLLASTVQKANWTAHFNSLLVSCDKRNPLEAERDLVRLFAHETQAIVRRTPDVYVVDGRSGVVLGEEGRIETAFPSASILKPLLVAEIQALTVNRRSKTRTEWRCPNEDEATYEREWGWQEALAKSCNGYFLDAAEETTFSLDPANRVLAAMKAPKLKSLPQAIGLVPGTEVTIRQVAGLFRYLSQQKPAVVDALSQTAISGTIAKEPLAPWFIEKRIALKTGTMRTSDAQPVHGWIAAIAPTPNPSSPIIAVLHGEGYAPSELLPELKRRLEEHLKQISPSAEVQLLGLVPPTKLSLTCADGGALFLQRSSRSTHWMHAALEASTLEADDIVTCYSAPIRARFPERSGRVRTRDYFGQWIVHPPSETETKGPATDRQRLARRGSSFVLRTTEPHYVYSVVASEFPNGSPELLKALAFAVRNNLQLGRHDDRPICDTTHCQVFANFEALGASKRKRIQSAVQSVIAGEVVAPVNIVGKWMPFSLGGSESWTKARSQMEVRSALERALDPNRLVLKGDRVEALSGDGSTSVALGSISCEDLRNRLRLPSCPESASLDKTSGQWTFTGKGEGHGLGLSLLEADLLARQGMKADQILVRYFDGPRSKR